MEYKYFTLDKNPKQFKRISIGEYSIELRIEWNTRSKAWYVLGYSGDEIVISNVKMTPNQLYSIDIDSEYDLPYMIGIVPKYTNHDWDTETTFLIVDNPLSNAVEGLTVDGGVIKRSIATSSDTHSRKALKGTENKYLFDVVSITQETGITIVCNGADASFKTVNLPQGRWDFTINGLRTITANTEAFRSLMNDYGVQIVDVGNNEYLWTNNSNQEIKIEGLYPYAAGYDFNVVESSNESAKIHSVDNNGWVNRFTVCLVPASSLIWTITSGEVSSDYQYVNFTGEQSVFESTARLSTTQALVEKYRGGLDPYSATIVNELTGVSDWILDSDNNQIKYYEAANPTAYYVYRVIDREIQSPTEACNYYYSKQTGVTLTNKSYSVLENGNVRCTATRKDNVSGFQDNIGYTFYRIAVLPPEKEEKTLPFDFVASQVISNAQSGNANAQVATTVVASSPSVVRSLSDSNMQQWQAVTDTIGQLTGASSWTFDNADEVVRYAVINPDLNAVASTLTQRHSRSPSDFVGVVAFTALIEGIGWVVDEDGKVAKPLIQPPSQAPKGKIYLVNGTYFPNSGSTHGNFESCKGYYTDSTSIVSCLQSKVKDSSYTVKLKSDYSTLYANALARIVNSTTPNVAVISTQAIELYKGDQRLTYFNLNVGIDPALSSQDPSQSYTPVSDSDIKIALQQALLNNNAALVAAIADAVAAAYTYDDVGFNELYDSLSITYQQVAERIAQNSKSVDQSIVLPANAYITEALLKFTDVDSIKSQFEANKQPK